MSRSQIAERVLELLEDKNTKRLVDKVSKYNKMFFISRATAYKRFSGEIPFSLSEIEFLCMKYHVSADWLLFGIGNKYRDFL